MVYAELIWLAAHATETAANGYEVIMKLLLERGAKLDFKTYLPDRTPLSHAAENGHKATVRLLLENGAEPEFKDQHGVTPLLCAAAKGHEAIVKLLLEKGAEPDSKDCGRYPGVELL
jgi:ankyrin repeat protein